MKDAIDFGNFLHTIFNNYIFRENSVLKAMPEWAITSGSRLDTLSKSGSKVLYIQNLSYYAIQVYLMVKNWVESI